MKNISGNSAQIVWPQLRDNNSQYIPKESIFNRDGTIDQIKIGENNYNRVWSFDDTNSGLNCGGVQSIACTRPGGMGSEIVPDLKSLTTDSEGNIIQINSGDICQNKKDSNVCHIFIEHMKLTRTKLYIQNDDRAIVLHLNLDKGVERRSDLIDYNYLIGPNAKICGFSENKDDDEKHISGM